MSALACFFRILIFFNKNGRFYKYSNQTRLVAHAILKIRIFDYKK
jgi:hypothetical protein